VKWTVPSGPTNWKVSAPDGVVLRTTAATAASRMKERPTQLS